MCFSFVTVGCELYSPDPRTHGTPFPLCAVGPTRISSSSDTCRCFPLRLSPTNPGPRGTPSDRSGVHHRDAQRHPRPGFVPLSSFLFNPVLPGVRSGSRPGGSRLPPAEEAHANVATPPTLVKAPFATIYSRNTAAIQDKEGRTDMSGGVLNLICCACVPQSTAGVVERFGKFSRVINPGLNFLACCIGEFVAGAVSLRVRQLDVTIETKTKDNVFVVVVVSVQYEVENDQVYDAFYRLTNPLEQIRAYVFDVVRSTVPKINLDDVFDQKDEIAKAVKTDLAQTMPSYGYHILQTLVTDIEPDSRVKSSMNEINAAQRQRVAAADKAEAEKILVVKGAEADAESKYLAGVGISRQRQAIVNGLRDSVQAFTREISDVSPRDVLEIMMMTQYFDMMKDVGSNSRTSTIFVPNTPGAVSDVSSQIRNGFLQATAGMPEQQNMRR